MGSLNPLWWLLLCATCFGQRMIRIWLNIILGYVCEGISREEEDLNWYCRKQMALPNVDAYHPTQWKPKKQTKNKQTTTKR
jgi:hypothetical protein